MATSIDGIKTSRVSPRFLHGNATSHTWLFSAFAELIDNAYDPDVNASELWIDVRYVGDTPDGHCITFVDNGNGMTPDKLYKMLSFGYCEKVAVGNVKPIGFYGNGFKSGSMRIGKDALVFTRCATSMSVGMLSQTYLENVKAEAVVVPVVTWDLPSKLRENTPESLANMKAIMRHSIFKSEHQLISELRSLEKMKTGTSILIYNLKRGRSGTYEIDFESDKYDLRNPETQMIDLTSINRPINQASPEYKRSLREYCSILYLKPKMKIVLRNKKVSTKLISKSLSKTEHDVYKPTWVERPIKLTFGFTNSEESESYGLMMYHENRLIKAYEKIGCQKQANNYGVGVVGVVETNFLEPIHNKQDFNRTDKYSAFMQNAASKLNDYYFEKTKNENPNNLDLSQMSQLPDWTWAQCDNCLSWRRLPTGYTARLPDKWYCRMNPDGTFNRCDIPEEPEDDDEALQPTYRKTYKKTMEEKKRHAKAEEAKRLREKEESLKNKERILKEKAMLIAKKQAEKEAQLRKKAEMLANQNQELEEVSSSQDKPDRKPTLGDLERARKSINTLQQEMKEKEKTIKDLEQKKIQIEEKSQAMLRMAESLKLSTDQGASLIDKIQEMSGEGSSTVTSSSGSSHGLRAPKRKHEMVGGDKNESEPGEKIVKIKTEDGGTIPVKIRNTGGEEIVDLTLDEEDLEEGAGGSNVDSSRNDQQPDSEALTEMEDMKPDKEELDKQMDEMSKEHELRTDENTTKSDETKIGESTSVETKEDENKSDKTKTDESTSVEKKADENKSDKTKTDETKSDKTKSDQDESSKTKSDQVESEETKADQVNTDETKSPKTDEVKSDEIKTEIKKELVSKHCQTVPTIVKFASPEEVELLKLSPVEQKEMLLTNQRELDETKKSLSSLQENIWKLLKIIVPDFDYGEPCNIEKTIIDFIQANDQEKEEQ